MRFTFKSVDFKYSRMPSITWVELIPSVEQRKTDLPLRGEPASRLYLESDPGSPAWQPTLQI